VPLQCEAGCSVSGNHPLAVIYEEAVHMKKAAIVMMVAFVAVMILVPAAMAQETGAATGGGKALGALAVAIGMGAAAFGCGLGQGRIASAACEGMARNPGAAGPIRAAMILGLVFVETLVLFTLAMLALKA
jgi:F-type H+-transporting ATPase subunit c